MHAELRDLITQLWALPEARGWSEAEWLAEHGLDNSQPPVEDDDLYDRPAPRQRLSKDGTKGKGAGKVPCSPETCRP